MRRLLLALVLIPGLAVAQQPLQLSFGPKGPVRYTVEEVASVRFLGEQVEGPTFAAGEELELVTEKDGWVRVKQGERYGWVPADKLAEQKPAADAADAAPPAEP